MPPLDSAPTALRQDEAAGSVQVAPVMNTLLKNEVVAHSTRADAHVPPTRSETQIDGGQERATMRNVALDFGGKVHLCEVAGGKVVCRKAAREIWDLRDVLGPNTPPARVAVEACREAWRLVEVLKEWGL